MFKKVTFVAISLLLFSLSAAAQDTMPTKEETINYIHKKMQEVLGFEQLAVSTGPKPKYDQVWFKSLGDNITLGIGFGPMPGSGYGGSTETFLFDPRHIKGVVVGKPRAGQSLANIGVNFLKGTLRDGSDLRVNTLDEPFVNIPYLATVPGNGDRIAKAILHLRDLAKAEDELFSN